MQLPSLLPKNQYFVINQVFDSYCNLVRPFCYCLALNLWMSLNVSPNKECWGCQNVKENEYNGLNFLHQTNHYYFARLRDLINRQDTNMSTLRFCCIFNDHIAYDDYEKRYHHTVTHWCILGSLTSLFCVLAWINYFVTTINPTIFNQIT